MKRFNPSLIIILILTLSSLAGAQSSMVGKVVEVTDGRTVVIEVEGRKIAAELQYIEVPDAEQPLHRTVREHLEKLTLGKTVEFRAQGFAPGKAFGQLYSGMVDVAVQMLRDGAAWHIAIKKSGQEASQNAIYQDHQNQARADKRGVWGLDGLKPASEYRAEKVKRERQAQIAAEFATSGDDSTKYEKAAESKAPVRRAGPWPDVNPWLKNPGPLVHGYNAASRTGYVGTSLMGVKELENQSPDRVTAVDITYIYKQEEQKVRKGTFVLTVVSSAADWRFFKSNTLTVIVDEKNVLIGKPKRVAAREDGKAVEKLTFEVSKAAVEKIVFGGQVWVKIGDYMLHPSPGLQLLLYNMLQVAE